MSIFFRFNKIISFTIGLIFFLYFLNQNSEKAETSKAIKGVLNLSEKDLSSKVIKLEGEWEFFPNELLLNSEINNKAKSTQQFFSIPGIWTKDIWSLDPETGNGYGTFRLHIILPKNHSKYGIYSNEQSTAHKYFLNDVSLSGSGTVGTNKDQSIPLTIPSISFFEANGNQIDILLQISNFHHRKGGPRRDIYFGTQENILNLKIKNFLSSIFFTGVLVTFILFHLSIYIFRRKDKSYLLFSIFCFLILGRNLTTGEILLLTYIPFLDYTALVRLEYISLYLSVPFGLHFVKYLFPNDFPKKFIQITYFISICFLFSLFLSVKYFSLGAPLYHSVMIIIIFIGIYFLIRAISQNRKYVNYLFLGIVPLFIFSINDILHSNDFINTGYFVQYGFWMLLFCESFILSSKFSNAINLNEDLLSDLEKKVIERTEQLNIEIKERKKINSELQLSMKQISKDLDLARRLQEKILPKKSEVIGQFRYCYDYVPLQIVGGDFINVTQIENKKLRYFICDVTGHGIQASLITFIINSEYEELKNKNINPSIILFELNKLLLIKYKALSLFLPSFIIDFDFTQNTAIYSSAGFPVQYKVRSGQVESLTPTDPILGIDIDRNFSDKEIDFHSQDFFVSFSDGLIEARTDSLEFFGDNKFIDMILKITNQNEINTIIEKILQKEIEFRNKNERNDDITLFILQKY